MLLSFWLISALALIVPLGAMPIERTQEARVLVTAREMIDPPPPPAARSTCERWMIPHMNGEVRLRKPPLAYWVSAGSMAIFGVNEFAGRLPMALAAWASLGLTMRAARRLFGSGAALLAGAALLSFIGFVRYATLAETDSLVMLFVTAAVYGIARGAGVVPAGRQRSASWRSWRWFHISAVAIALAALAKGPPAAYPLLFLLALSAIERRWSIAFAWLRSGAPLTLLLLAAPWFLIMMNHPNARQAVTDMRVSALGEGGHADPISHYFAQLLKLTAPACGFVALAFVAAAQRWREDGRLRALVVWVLAILLPLLCWQSKQPHYLLPLAPPLALLVGWFGHVLLGSHPSDFWMRSARVTWWITLAGCAIFAGTILIVGAAIRGELLLLDGLLAASIVVASVIAWMVAQRRSFPAAILVFFALFGVIAVPLFGLWRATFEQPNIRAVARRIASDFADRPSVFFQGGGRLSLCFYLRSVIPVVDTESELRAALAARPNLIVIVTSAPDDPSPPPGVLTRAARYPLPDRNTDIYVLPAAAHATPP